jgi:hypothetical protein
MSQCRFTCRPRRSCRWWVPTRGGVEWGKRVHDLKGSGCRRFNRNPPYMGLPAAAGLEVHRHHTLLLSSLLLVSSSDPQGRLDLRSALAELYSQVIYGGAWRPLLDSKWLNQIFVIKNPNLILTSMEIYPILCYKQYEVYPIQLVEDTPPVTAISRDGEIAHQRTQSVSLAYSTLLT